MFKKSRKRSKQGGGSSFRSFRSTGSNTSSSVSTKRGILKLPPSHVRDQQSVGGSSGGSRSTSTKLSLSVKSRKVGFGNVTFREFERVLGDNPSCSSGAPISIGWRFTNGTTRTIDEYERQRRPRRLQPDLVLSRHEREELLVEWGASFQEIIESIRSNIKIKNQRRTTVNAIGRYDRWEEMMESAGRKIKRTIGLQKGHSQAHQQFHHPHHNPHPQQNNRSQSQQQQQQQQHIRSLEQPANSVPKKPQRRIGMDSPTRYTPSACVSRELLHGTMDPNLNDDKKEDEQALSLHGSSGIPDVSPPPEDSNRPKLAGQGSGLSYDSLRPTSHIELDAVPDCGISVYSMQSGIAMSEQTDVYSESGDTFSSDGFGYLRRDTSYWAVGGMDSPQLLRRFHPTVISEDGNYDHMMPPTMDNWQYQGFGMQPPPYSNAIVNRWT